MDRTAEEALRDAAADWFARMQAPDAERSRPAFEAWLAESPAHKRAYDRMAANWQRARLITHTPTGQAWQGLPKRPRPRVAPWGYAVAAGIAALLVVGVLLRPHGPGAGLQIAAQELASPVGIRTVRLGDGSVVTLDAGARMTLRFSAAERRVELETGRARFETAPDAARPFVVAARDREVVANGTVFDVTCEDGKISVALLRGGLQIRDMRSGAARAIAQLSPGQVIELAAGDVPPAPQVLSDTVKDWPSGMVEFDGTPLRDVIAAANRYSTRKLVLGDPAIGELRVTGGYRMGDAQRLAATLAAAFDLRIEPGAGQSIILLPAHPRTH